MTLRFEISDDYREGPRLNLSDCTRVTAEECEDSGDCTGDHYDVTFSRVEEGTFAVFELAFDRGDGESRLMKSFKTKEEAKHYAMVQSRIHSGQNPFVSNGNYSAAYHPEGSRLDLDALSVDEDGDPLKPDFTLKPEFDEMLWLFIMDSDGFWDAYATGAGTVW